MDAHKTASRHGDAARTAFFEHSAAPRVNTNSVIARALTAQHPNLALVVVSAATCDLLAFATSTGEATFHPVEAYQGAASTGGETVPLSLALTQYVAPSNRGEQGSLREEVLLGKYLYAWKGHDCLVYAVDGRDGTGAYPMAKCFYLLGPSKERALELVHAASKWTSEPHDEVWVFDGGYWQKSAALYESVRNASWDSVILDASMKKAIIEDHMSFFASQDTYAKLKVPWKRGVIYHGPPGNGKTISIKAMMHTLYSRKDPIPTLYVRSLATFAGPEYAVNQIFDKARRMAPCYLILEDLDTIITEQVRSYFFNEVDGLKSNDGIFMVGSTNHLDRLDPGITKRPSRFDRKYLFSDPNEQERTQYCHFWQKKLEDNKEIDFPDALCDAVAAITDKFSFAYMQEAFVAALLAIARSASPRSTGEDGDGSMVEDVDGDWVGVHESERDGGLDKNVLWIEIKKQIEMLRKNMDQEQG